MCGDDWSYGSKFTVHSCQFTVWSRVLQPVGISGAGTREKIVCEEHLVRGSVGGTSRCPSQRSLGVKRKLRNGTIGHTTDIPHPRVFADVGETKDLQAHFVDVGEALELGEVGSRKSEGKTKRRGKSGLEFGPGGFCSGRRAGLCPIFMTHDTTLFTDCQSVFSRYFIRMGAGGEPEWVCIEILHPQKARVQDDRKAPLVSKLVRGILPRGR